MSNDIRGPDVRELAEKDYILGMKYKDIAEKYGVTLNTVKSWKTRYKWNREGMHTKKKVCTPKTNGASKKKELIEDEVIEVLENTDLTDNQRLFCIYYIKCFNATKAYQKAYGCSYSVANSEGYKLLVNPCIKEEIGKLKQHKLNRALLSEEDIFQKYLDIAFVDIGDYLSWGQEEIPVMGAFGPIKDEEGNELTRVINVVKFRESTQVDGSIISEVKQGKEGASIKLHDKMKALQWLSDRMDLLPKDTKEKLEIEKSKLEIIKLKVGETQEEQIEDDGFIAALEGSVSEVWSNEEDGG